MLFSHLLLTVRKGISTIPDGKPLGRAKSAASLDPQTSQQPRKKILIFKKQCRAPMEAGWKAQPGDPRRRLRGLA